MNNSNTANLEFRSRCCILRTWRVGVYDLACWGMRPSVLGGNLHEQRNLRTQGRMQIKRKMSQKALNRIWALPNYSSGPGFLRSSGMIDLQNNCVCEVFKYCKFTVSNFSILERVTVLLSALRQTFRAI